MEKEKLSLNYLVDLSEDIKLNNSVKPPISKEIETFPGKKWLGLTIKEKKTRKGKFCPKCAKELSYWKQIDYGEKRYIEFITCECNYIYAEQRRYTISYSSNISTFF